MVITTEPPVYAKSPFPAGDMADLFRRQGDTTLVEPDASKALDLAVSRAGPEGSVLVTGSFYLVGALRDRWYPKKAVVSERTSFPCESG